MRFLLPVFAMLSLAACSTDEVAEDEQQAQVAPILTSEQAFDEMTFARPTEARVTHVSLDLELDFEAQRVFGTATLDVDAKEGVNEIVLDSDGLEIGGVTDGLGNDVDWELGERVADKGEPLTVKLGEPTGPDLDQIVISYASAPEAGALQWLEPEQTAGGEYPFLFSQGQAIRNRTWIPTQDSPGIRQTWDARIVAPDPLTVVMSGIEAEDETEELENERRAFYFAMDKPVAPYLIAVAAGNLKFAPLGPRSGVWAEPEVVMEAARELTDTEAMIDAAEELFGEYRWGRYDMIVLPPSFPFGGMENPVMTFLTPTFIAGDRSNTGLIAHELAHSWSGNLVTYASWRDGWLNEGVTSYIESRISEAVFDKTRADQEYALSFASLEEMVEENGPDNPNTAMRTPASISPFDTSGTASYEKGTAFLRTVESIVGRERLDEWLRGWFDRHAFQPATSEMFLADMRENLIAGDEALEEKLMLDEWVYGTGIPESVVRPPDTVFAEVDGAVEAFAEDYTLDAEAWAQWTTAERLRFLRGLPQSIPEEELARMDGALGLSETGNNEVLFDWLQIALRNRYEPAVATAKLFLARVGRSKFVYPLYETLKDQGSWGMQIARPLYDRARAGYHSSTRSSVDELLGYQAETGLGG